MILFFLLTKLASFSKADDSTLKVAVPNAILNIDPRLTTNAQERFLLPLVFQPLFYIDAGNNVKPSLAESYQQTGKNVVTVNLRRGQLFSDGTEVDAFSVVSSVSVLCAQGSSNLIPLRSLSGCSRGQIPKVKAVGKYSISFETNGSTNYFLYELSSPFIFVFKNAASGTIGSGQFKVISQNPNILKLERVIAKIGLPKNIELVYVREKDISDTLNKRIVDIASMYDELEISSVDSEKVHRLQSSRNVTTTLVLNPKKLILVPKKVLEELHLQISSSNELASCAKRASSATGIVPEGIGGYIPPTFKKPSLPYKLKHRITLIIHQAADRLLSCDTDALKKIFDAHNIALKISYDDDYTALKKRYGSSSLDGYLEHFVFYTRDAGRFFSRFTHNSNDHFFYINSRKIFPVCLK